MKARVLIASATLGLAITLVVPATAQSWQRPGGYWGWSQDRDHDRDDRDRDDRRAYQDGYRDGDRDRDHHSRWNPRGRNWRGDDRRAYEAGYRVGYNGNRGWDNDRDRDRDRDRDGDRDRDHDGDRDRGYGWRGPEDRGYGGYGRNGNQAYRNGYADGLRYGQNDRSRNKGYNSTGSGYYEKATNGYYSGWGNKDDYKREYREGYQDGYQRGYKGR